MSMLERAKKAVGTAKDNEFASWLGVAQSVVAGYKRRETVPLEQLIKVSEQSGVSLDWLILGKGEMQGGSTVQQAWQMLDAQRDGRPAVVFVPLYDVAVSAGNGADVYGEQVLQQVPFEAAWLHHEGLHRNDLACLPITGDSMTPGLMPGDIVLVNHGKRDGDGVFVLRFGNSLRIKRLQWLADGSLRISSDNALYQAEHITPADLGDDFAIIGACHTKIGRVF